MTTNLKTKEMLFTAILTTAIGNKIFRYYLTDKTILHTVANVVTLTTVVPIPDEPEILEYQSKKVFLFPYPRSIQITNNYIVEYISALEKSLVEDRDAIIQNIFDAPLEEVQNV